jgi:cation diffusion facilitator family transporter
MTISKFIVNRLLYQRSSDPQEPENRSRIGQFCGWISIIGNILLFGLKLAFGIISNSISLIADAFHTLSDVATSMVVIIGFRISQKPADKEHPFGHGRAEAIAALTVAVLIAVVGIEFIKSSIIRFIGPDLTISVNVIVLSVVFTTIIIKELMAKLSFSLGEIINSDALRGDGLHHRSDMLSSVLVLLGLFGVWIGYTKLDAIMGIGIAIIMLLAGYQVARNAIDDLLGRPVSQKTLDNIHSLACEVDGVGNVHDIVVHNYGAKSYISLHVELPEGQEPARMHQIADKVERCIAHRLHADVITHIDPVTVDGSEVKDVKRILAQVMQENEMDGEIQDLRVVAGDPVESILFEVPVPVNFGNQENLEEKFKQSLSEIFPSTSIMIEFKPQITAV